IGPSAHRTIDSLQSCPSSVVRCQLPRTTDYGLRTTDYGLIMAIDHSKMRLGKLPRRHDPRTPKLGCYMKSALPPAPPCADYTRGITDWGMMLNDQLG